MDKIKDAILESLPGSLGKRLYFLKNGTKIIHSEILDNVFLDMEIREKDALWTKRLSTKRGHEVAVCEWFEENLKANDVFFDVGSCYGIFSALVARLQPSVPVHSFEPDFLHAYFLEENAKHNKGEHNWVISDKYVGKHDDAKNTTIDSHCKKHNIYPTVMKMDIDGGEYNALIGMKDLIARKKTHFLIEVHPIILRQNKITIQQILDFFDDSHIIKVLPEIRDKVEQWSDDLSLIGKDKNPYIYVAPKEIALI